LIVNNVNSIEPINDVTSVHRSKHITYNLSKVKITNFLVNISICEK
jgi:hypothetical protein